MPLRIYASALVRTVARALLSATGRRTPSHVDDGYEAWLTETFAR